ncbi:MAG: AmmeMemoRadiSam system protein B [Gammaproteobacteria bacterium]|nr:AmmeMemoRadiSam system protein B [Gammaproteobacteria bacterium]MBU1414367.1 AmmeMemoRadiSam system protein B [Gammaproteobacteria bacterium]
MNIPFTRPAAVAGLFYPGDARALRGGVISLLSAQHGGVAAPKALIVPHAGYVYSGPVAASAYAALEKSAPAIRRVVMFGPAHRVWVRGLAVSSAGEFATPLGMVPVDRQAIAAVEHLPQVEINDEAHAEEHSLEVQLPFLQMLLDDFAVAPFVVGGATPAQVAEVMETLWGGPETLIVVSSDLSHYLPYAEAQLIDRATADSILERRPLSRHEQACGATPINGLIEVARRKGLAPRLLDLRNSGDTAGDRSRVVGYGAFAFAEHGHD